MMMGAPVGPSIWVVSDGRAGIERQAVAIARALGDLDRWPKIAHIRSDAHRAEPIRIDPQPPQVMLPPDMWPAPLAALPTAQRAQFKAPWPDVWIGSGRRAVPYSMRVRNWSDGKTLVVQTQDPRVSLDTFDLVVPPEHDEVRGPNVLSTRGAPAFFPADEIEEALLQFGALADEPGRKVAVILGGTSKTHAMPEKRAAEIEAVLRKLAGAGDRLWITVSRRTPEHARIRFRSMADQVGARYWESEAVDGPNPYLAYLAMADVALVTEDSANMLSEIAFFGTPAYLINLPGQSDKFDRLHESFIDCGAARWFEGRVETWEYERIREVDRVADKIVDLLLERHPQPDFVDAPELS